MKKRATDKTLLILIGVLLVFGIIMIYNSTIVYSQETLGSAYKLVLQQIAWVIVGLVGFFAFYKVDYQKLKKLSLPLFGISLIFLLFLHIIC